VVLVVLIQMVVQMLVACPASLPVSCAVLKSTATTRALLNHSISTAAEGRLHLSF
jgi:hypothetical protein